MSVSLKKDEKIDAGFPSGNCFSNFGHLGVSATGNVTLVIFVKYHQDLFLDLSALLLGIMGLPVMDFQDQGYKIRKNFA